MEAPNQSIAGAAGHDQAQQALARVLRRVATSAASLAQASSTPAPVMAAAVDASTVCQAASELILSGSRLAPELTRVAFGSLTALTSACQEHLSDAPPDRTLRGCLRQTEACQELYLQVYMRARGFSCERKAC